MVGEPKFAPKATYTLTRDECDALKCFFLLYSDIEYNQLSKKEEEEYGP